MTFNPEGGADEPSLIVDGVRIPFQMEAHVIYGASEDGPGDGWSDRDDDAPWMIHLPVELQVLIPHDILYPPTSAPPPPPPPAPIRGGPGSTSGTGDFVPHGRGRAAARKRPVTVRALEGLGLGETLDQRVGGRSAGLVFPVAPDAGDPTGVDDDWQPPAVATGQAGTTTGDRALDAVFAAGRIGTLARMLRPSGPTRQGAGTEGSRPAIQPVSDHRSVGVPGIERANGDLAGSPLITQGNPPAVPSASNALDSGLISAALRRGMRIGHLPCTQAM